MTQQLILPIVIAVNALFVGWTVRDSITGWAAVWIGFAFCISAFATQSVDFIAAWRYGWGQALTVMACALLVFLNRKPYIKKLTAICLIVGGAANLLLDSRTLALVSIVSGLLVWLSDRKRIDFSVKRVLLGAGIATIAGWLAYSWAAPIGILGRAQEQKFIAQTGSGFFSLLLDGRPEFVPDLLVAIQHPLIGVGATENVSSASRDFALSIFSQLRPLDPTMISYLTQNGFRTHSIILNAWICGGLLSLAGWLIVLIVLIRSISMTLQGEPGPMALRLICIMLAIWELVFSPATTSSYVILICGLALALQASPRSTEEFV